MTERLGNPAGKMCGIYRLEFSNGVFYIGQSVNIRRRHLQHISTLQKGKHTNDRLQKCFNKYGEPSCTVLEYCDPIDLNNKETAYIYEGLSSADCANVCIEGRSRLGVKSSDSAKRKISEYQKLLGKVKPVDMFSDDFEYLGSFQSIKEAETFLSASPKDVQKSCKSNGYYRVKGRRFLFSVIRNGMLSSVKNAVPF